MLLILRSHLTTLCGLLDREADTASLQVQIDDLHPQLLTRGDDLFRQVDMVCRHFGDVYESLDTVAHLHERAERDEFGDSTVDQFADTVARSELLPGILLGSLQREADALAAEIYLEDLHFDLVADAHHRVRVVDVLPGELRHVDQAVHPAEVDEGAEVDHRRHHAVALLAGLEIVEERLALLLLCLFEPGSAGQHDVVAVLVEFDDLGLEVLPDVGLEVPHPAQFDQRRRQEPAQADVHDQATLDDLDHQTLDHSTGFLDALDLAPGPFVLGAFLGQEQASVLVLLGEDECFDALTHGDDLVGRDVVADRQLTAGDHAFGLVADIEQDLILVDPHDCAFDELAVLDENHGGGVRLLDIHPPEVCVDYLAGGVVSIGIEGSESRLGLDGCVGLHSALVG